MPVQSTLRHKAEALRSLHRPGTPLLLPNAWDCATAKIVEGAGFPAVATTSAGIAFAQGFPDGERVPFDRMIQVVARIARCVAVPVTADMEAGYGDSFEEVRRSAAAVLEAGAVGMNLEDAARGQGKRLTELSDQLEKIRAVREAGRIAGVPIVLNARTDVYLAQIGPEEGRFEEAVRRGAAYRDAGADCVFVPGVTDEAVIGELVRRLGCPINVLAAAGGPSVPALARRGVSRISLGSGPARAAATLLKRLAEELASAGTYSLLEGILSHAAMNALMAEPASGDVEDGEDVG